MEVGISTASLFGRFATEDGLKFLSQSKVPCTEVFLESFCEYNESFANLLKTVKGQIKVHSVHTLTTQFEPTLYSVNQRAQGDSFKFLEDVMNVAKIIGADYYTFHGGARFKRTPFVIDYDRVAIITQRIIDVCANYGVKLAYENVHWGYYNYKGFFSELRKRTNGLKATLDIKQARQSDLGYADFIEDMGSDIVTVHLSDIDENGKMCLPGKGITDFNDLFSRLAGVGFNGAMLLEVYKSDFNHFQELFDSMEYVKELARKYFK